MNKRIFLWAALGIIILTPIFVIFDNSSKNFTRSAETAVPTAKPFVRSSEAIDFSALKFTEWDYKAAAEKVRPRDKKPYTLMIYMNGSDLESENGAATSDLAEMLTSGVDTSAVNIVLFTGGANRWQNSVVPENECMVWEISNGRLKGITGVGLLNMGDPGTLAGFVSLGYTAFPAEKYALIMWDHGGGAIAGYGQDEKFDNSNLTLLDMNYAFSESPAADEKLELLGFDSCLMATSEMAVVASDYARYMIASEDLEPGDGWDYSFLPVFNTNPGMTGAELGKAIAGQFMKYYKKADDEILTISVTDLSRAGHVMSAMGSLMSKCGGKLSAPSSFQTLARKRGATVTFGEGSPRDNQCDMVDLGDMARRLSDLYPNEANLLINELNSAVIYNKNNSNIQLGGLSAYYIYGGRKIGRHTLRTYNSLYMDGDYTDYLNRFFKALDSDKTSTRSLASASDDTPADVTAWREVPDKPGRFIMMSIQDNAFPNGFWPKINGGYVCMFPIDNGGRKTLYAVPARVNEQECNIVVVISPKRPYGKILGVRRNDGLIIQKGFKDIQADDKIQLYFKEYNFNNKTEEWVLGGTLDASNGLMLQWDVLSPDMYIGTQYEDAYGNLNYTRPVKAY